MSIADTVGVKITGDASGAVRASELSGEAVAAAASFMKSKLTELGFASKEAMGVVGSSSLKAAAEVETAGGVIGRATNAMKEHIETVKTKYEGVAEGFSKINEVMLAAAAVFAGGELFKEMISDTVRLTAETRSLSRVLGINLEAASGLHAALAGLGVSSDVVTSATQKLVRQMKTHEDQINAVGVATRDSNGHLLDGQTVMMNSIAALRSYKEGLDQDQVAQTLFGRGVADLVPMLRLTEERLKAAAEEAKALGLVITPAELTTVYAYTDALHGTGHVFEGIAKVIGDAVMPVLTRLAEWFNGIGPNVVEGFAVAMTALGDVLSVVGDILGALWDIAAEVFHGIGDIISIFIGGVAVPKFNLWKVVIAEIRDAIRIFADMLVIAVASIVGSIEYLAGWLKLLGGVAVAAFKLDWNGIKSAWSDGLANLETITAATADRITAKLKDVSAAFAAALKGEASERAETPDGPMAGTRTAPDPKPKKEKKEKKEKADPSQMTAFEDELVALKSSLDAQNDAQNTFHEFSKAAEAKYWQDILSRNDLSAKDRAAITRKYLEADLADKKQHFEAMIAAEAAQIADTATSGAKRVEIARTISAQVTAAYGEGSKQAIAAEREVTKVIEAEAKRQAALAVQLAETREVAQLGAIAAEEAAAKHRVDMGFETAAQLLAAERDLENQRYAILIAGIAARRAAAALDPSTSEAAIEQLNKRLEAIDIAHQKALTKNADDGAKARAAITRSSETATVGLFSQSLSKMVTLQQGFTASIQGLYQGLQTIIGGALSQIISRMLTDWLAAHGVMKAVDKLFGISEIATSSGKAGAATYASTAAIPIVGPELAPAAAVTAAAGAASFGSLLSAAGGYDIPSGINPVVQTHAREMILPAQYADMIRGMTGNGGKGGGGDTYHIHAMDAGSFRDFAKRNQTVFAATVKGAVRDGAR